MSLVFSVGPTEPATVTALVDYRLATVPSAYRIPGRKLPAPFSSPGRLPDYGLPHGTSIDWWECIVWIQRENSTSHWLAVHWSLRKWLWQWSVCGTRLLPKDIHYRSSTVIYRTWDGVSTCVRLSCQHAASKRSLSIIARWAICKGTVGIDRYSMDTIFNSIR